MTAETAIGIYEAIPRTVHADLKRDLETAAVTYAHWRARWRLASREERGTIDDARSAAHGVLIDACNILARAMSRSGENSAWRERLGEDRKEIGDFACHVHCLLAISAR